MMATLLKLIMVFSIVVHAIGNIKFTDSGGSGMELQALNAVLEAEPLYRDFVILITAKDKSLINVAELRAPWGYGKFEVEVEDSEDLELLETHMTQTVAQARQLRHISWSATVVVVSDDPAFLATFAEWSLKGRLLVFSSRLLVLTRLPLVHLHQIRKTLSMSNSILLQIRNSTETRINLYVDLPYLPPTSRPLHVAHWSPEEGLVYKSPSPIYPNKFTRLSGRPRLVVSRVLDPTDPTEVIDDPDHPGEKKIIVQNRKNYLTESLGKAMNFTIKYIKPVDNQFGMPNEDGTWTGMIGNVYRGEADIGQGMFTITPQRYEVVDFCYPGDITYITILSARGSPEVTVWAFLLPITAPVWGAIMLALILHTVAMVLPACLPVKTFNRFRLQNSASNCIRILLQQNLMESAGWWWWERVMLGVWMLMMLVLTRSYAGNLMSQLAVRYIPEPIHSLQDLVTNPVTVMIYAGTSEETAFRTAKSGPMYDVWNLRKENRVRLFQTEFFSQMISIISKGSASYIELDNNLKRRMAWEYGKSGRCDFYLARERAKPSMDALALSKDNPLIPVLNRRVMQITEAGLFDYWQKSLLLNLTICINSPRKYAITSPLAISNIWVMFMVLVGGVFVSLCVFCLEMSSTSLPHCLN